MLVLLVAITAIWVFFAVGINWADAGGGVFGLLVGSDAVFHGEVWRLFTNVFLHQPSGSGSVWHLLTTLGLIYFLGASLEERWGWKRFILFTLGAAWIASALQLVLGAVIPKLGQPAYFGGLGMGEAIAVAWAMAFKNQKVQLFFVLPVSGFGLILFTLAMNFLYILANEAHHEGLVTPFGGMLAGYLLSDASPLRRFYLQMRFKSLQKQSAALRALRSEGSAPRLRVIEGGGRSQKPDKSMLN
jgi:membrane associated rhomboid family serine protease